MTHYDHATAMAYKLDRWSEEPDPRNYELERLAHERKESTVVPKKWSVSRGCRAISYARTKFLSWLPGIP